MTTLAHLTALFCAVFVLNLLPAFAPPTWLLLSFLGLTFPEGGAWPVAGVAAAAATAGRGGLALLSQHLVQGRWVPPGVRRNLVQVGAAIRRRRGTASGLFLLFAFSPLPSNALFLAYGLTKAPLALILAPFFVGRVVSYAVAFSGSAAVATRFDLELGTGASLAYFVLTQGASLALVYAFSKVDWQRTVARRSLCWTDDREPPGPAA